MTQQEKLLFFLACIQDENIIKWLKDNNYILSCTYLQNFQKIKENEIFKQYQGIIKNNYEKYIQTVIAICNNESIMKSLSIYNIAIIYLRKQKNDTTLDINNKIILVLHKTLNMKNLKFKLKDKTLYIFVNPVSSLKKQILNNSNNIINSLEKEHISVQTIKIYYMINKSILNESESYLIDSGFYIQKEI